jgi:glycosyltransferase involved in cell wall biosynthesis
VISDLQGKLGVLEEHIVGRRRTVFGRVLRASRHIAPWGTLRGQLAGYVASTLALPVLCVLWAIARVKGRRSVVDEATVANTTADAFDEATSEAAETRALPLISVIMPVYNAERSNRPYLSEALQSAAGQIFRNFEIIVVDDGSTDGSAEIVRQFIAAHPELDMKLLQKANGGQSSARNFGAKHTTGSWLAFLDQDDVWMPERLQIVAPSLNESVDLVYTDADTIDENGEIEHRNVHARLSAGGRHPKTDMTECLCRDVFVMPGVTTVRKELFVRIDGFDERLSGYEDDDFFVRALQAGRIGYVPASTLRWRFYGSNYSSSRRMIDSRLYYWQKLLREHADSANDRGLARRITLRFLRECLSQCSMQLDEEAELASYNLDAALKLLPHAGPIDRVAFALTRWSWSRRGKLARQARLWFMHGLERADPGVSV